jgi:hypothetical protein
VVLLLMLVAAGWFLIGRDGAVAPVLPAAGTATTTGAPPVSNPD